VFSGPDGGSTDGAANDVVGDVTAFDAITNDGGTDDASDGSTAFTCNPAPSNTILCDDFESSNMPGSKFVSTFVYGGGAVAFDTVNYVTPTHAVTFTAPAISTTPAFADLLSEGTNVTTSTVSLHAALRIHQIDTTQDVSLMRISYAAPSTLGHVTFDVVATTNALALAVTEPTPDGGTSVAKTFALTGYVVDKWEFVRVDVTTSPDVSVAAYVGTLQVVAPTILSVPAPSANDKVRDALVGIIYLPGSAIPTSIDVDDFLFRGM
jgi:hypothetical protein